MTNYGLELWNQPTLGTDTERRRVTALGGDCFKMRPYEPSDSYSNHLLIDWIFSVCARPLVLLRRTHDGRIDVDGQIAELGDLPDHIRARGGTAIYILDNECNHERSPYRNGPISDYIQDLARLSRAVRDKWPWLSQCSPPMAVHQGDVQWLAELAGTFNGLQIEYRGAHIYWQADKWASPEFGQRMNVYSRIIPDARWIVDEVGDATPIGEKSPEQRADHVLAVMTDLARRGDVEAATLFNAGGTREWELFWLTPLDLERIGRTLDGMRDAVAQPAFGGGVGTTTIGNGFRIRDRTADPLLHRGQYARRDLSLVRGIAIHHSGVDTDPYSDHAAAAAGYHISSLGWPGMAYHVTFQKENNVWLPQLCQPLDRISYHVAGRNAELVGIMLPGDYTAREPENSLLQAARQVVAEVQYTFGAFLPVRGHREWALPEFPTACPGDSYTRWLFRLQVAQQSKPQFVLGFGDLARSLGKSVVGDPVEPERRVPVTLQETTTGMMLWEMPGKPAQFLRKG